MESPKLVPIETRKAREQEAIQEKTKKKPKMTEKQLSAEMKTFEQNKNTQIKVIQDRLKDYVS